MPTEIAGYKYFQPSVSKFFGGYTNLEFSDLTAQIFIDRRAQEEICKSMALIFGSFTGLAATLISTLAVTHNINTPPELIRDTISSVPSISGLAEATLGISIALAGTSLGGITMGGKERTTASAKNCAIIVLPGDSLSILEAKHGLNRRSLANYNSLPDTTIIHPGDILLFPKHEHCLADATGGAETKNPYIDTLLKKVTFINILHPYDGKPVNWGSDYQRMNSIRQNLASAVTLSRRLGVPELLVQRVLANLKIAQTDGRTSRALVRNGRIELSVSAHETDIAHEFAHFIIPQIVNSNGLTNIAFTESPPRLFTQQLGKQLEPIKDIPSLVCAPNPLDYDYAIGIGEMITLENKMHIEGKHPPTISLPVVMSIIYFHYLNENPHMAGIMPEEILFQQLERIYGLPPNFINATIQNNLALSCYR